MDSLFGILKLESAQEKKIGDETNGKNHINKSNTGYSAAIEINVFASVVMTVTVIMIVIVVVSVVIVAHNALV